MNPSLEETVTFDFVTSSPTTGAAADADSTPSFEVFEDTTDTALTLTGSTIAKRTGKTGNYRATFAVAASDGFEAGKSYNVVASATVGGVAGKAVVGRFQARARDVDDVLPTASYTAPLSAAQTQTECQDALQVYHLDHLFATSASVNDATAAADEFETTLTEADGFWEDAQLTFTSGALAGQSRVILAYAQAGGLVSLDEPLTAAPANGVTFVVKAVHVHTKSQVASSVWANGTRTLTAIDEDVTTLDLDRTVQQAVGLASANLDTQLADLPTVAEFEARTLVAANYATAANLAAVAGFLDTEVAAILEDTGTTLPAQISALNNLSAAQVNAEVVDALATDTYAQPAGVPSATVSLAEKVGRLYQALTSELTVTASAKTFFTHGGAALWVKNLSDDATTYTEGDGAAP